MSFPKEIKRIRQRSFPTWEGFADKVGVAFFAFNIDGKLDIQSQI